MSEINNNERSGKRVIFADHSIVRKPQFNIFLSENYANQLKEILDNSTINKEVASRISQEIAKYQLEIRMMRENGQI